MVQYMATVLLALASLGVAGLAGPDEGYRAGDYPPRFAGERALCVLRGAQAQLDRARLHVRHAAALARSGRGTQRALDAARLNHDAAQHMLRRAEFAVAEAAAAFGPLPPARKARCDR